MQIGIGISPTIPGQNTFGKGATLALDFTRNSFSSATQTVSDPSLLTGWSFTRASTKTALNSSGAVVSFAPGVPAITDLGFLIEEARTNLALQSQTFSNAAWSKNSATVTPAAATGPDGTLSASKIVEAAANTFHGVSELLTLVSGTTYTQYFILKAGERTWAALTEGNNVTAKAYINLATGALGTVSGTGSPSARVTPLINGWYLVELTFTPIANSGNIQVRAATGDGGDTYLGDGASGIYAWQGQMEAGAKGSSPIFATSAAVTRAADVAKITGLSAPSQGTLLVYGLIQVASGQVGLAALNDGTANNRADLRYNNGGILSFGTAGGVSQWSALAPSGSAALGTPFHAALSFTVGAQTVTLNGAGNATATGASIGAGMTQLQIGAVDNGIAQTNGYIQRLILNPTPNTGLAQ